MTRKADDHAMRGPPWILAHPDGQAEGALVMVTMGMANHTRAAAAAENRGTKPTRQIIGYP